MEAEIELEEDGSCAERDEICVRCGGENEVGIHISGFFFICMYRTSN